ncbi:hypothetical protein ACFC34_38695 [Streptomyces sp. NPDC056053]|uniref:hypothetical protein n=1 Tax=Streptomyces sp. NPDC056053 TaxID=3345696 RepID=UPI0035D95EEF
MLGTTFRISPNELKEIFDRLQPYLPKNLTKVGSSSSWLRFEHTFTGREQEPVEPPVHTDPRLGYVSESENPVEHRLREMATTVLATAYEQARGQWRDAAYVVALKDVVQDAPALWRTYQDELKALEAAYGYLRTPGAAKERPSALSRLVDAQDRTRAAAAVFDGRAEEIARVHDTYLYSDLSHDAALKAAGYPAAKDWAVASSESYGQDSYGDYVSDVPLQERVRRLTEQQDAHVAKVGRLSGTAPQVG